MRRVPLRFRVALGYGAVGLLLSLAFAMATTFVADDYEEIFVAALLDGQAQTYLDKLAANPKADLPRSLQLSVYRRGEAPAPMRGLAPGNHEIDMPGREGVHVGVYDRGATRLLIALDVGQIEALEHYLAALMLTVVVLGTGLSAWLGWWLSARSLLPVMRLARSVEDLPLRPQATQLATGYGDDGLGRIALAIDGYQARLADADVREKSFFADASHELRTPIAVIQGAVEVLKDDPATSVGQLSRLERIDRSIAELSILLEALLLSARGLPADFEALDLGELCRGALGRIAVSQPQAVQRLKIDGEGPPVLMAPRRWVSCLLEALLYKVLVAQPNASWRLALGADGLRIFQPSNAGTDNKEIRQGDLGIGIVFVERLCRSLGWKLQQEVSPNEGLSIYLLIPPRPAVLPAADAQ